MTFYSWDTVPEEHNRSDVIHRRIFDENVQVQLLTIEPGGEPAELHDHLEIEQFFCVLEGEWEMRVDEEKRRVGPGDVIYVAPGQIHNITLLGDTTGKVIEVYQPVLSTELAEERKRSANPG